MLSEKRKEDLIFSEWAWNSEEKAAESWEVDLIPVD